MKSVLGTKKEEDAAASSDSDDTEHDTGIAVQTDLTQECFARIEQELNNLRGQVEMISRTRNIFSKESFDSLVNVRKLGYIFYRV